MSSNATRRLESTRKRKARSLVRAERLKADAMPLPAGEVRITALKAAERMVCCAKQRAWVYTPSGDATQFAASRYQSCGLATVCEDCASYKARDGVADLRDTLRHIVAMHPTAQGLFLTFTQRTVPVERTQAAIVGIRKAIKTFLGYARVKASTLGSFWRIEVVLATKNGVTTAHVHVHVLTVVDPAVYRGKNWLHQRQWAGLFKKAAKLTYTPVTWVKRVEDASGECTLAAMESVAVELFKYVLKDGDADPTALADTTLAPGVMLTVWQALRRQRMHGFDRAFAEARKRRKRARQQTHSGEGQSVHSVT